MRRLRRLLFPHRRSTLLMLVTLIPALALQARAEAVKATASVTIQPGDHISIIGNTLADRMQHDGWLEAYLYSRFPGHDLAIRNLGFSVDELTLRLRSANFGTPDEWLVANDTDVILAGFGSSEAYAGEAGLAKFKTELESFLK